MPWIEFHPDEISELQKFEDFRIELNWSENEALGFLGRFWGKVLKLRESGDISGWKPEYIVRLTQAKTTAKRLWPAMIGRWLDERGGKVLVHDWLDIVGRYLKRRYENNKPQLLVDIWTMHGLVFPLSEKQQRKLAEDSAALASLQRCHPPNPPDQGKPTPNARCIPGPGDKSVDNVDRPAANGNGQRQVGASAPRRVTTTAQGAEKDRRLMDMRVCFNKGGHQTRIGELQRGRAQWYLSNIRKTMDPLVRIALQRRAQIDTEEVRR